MYGVCTVHNDVNRQYPYEYLHKQSKSVRTALIYTEDFHYLGWSVLGTLPPNSLSSYHHKFK